MIFCCTRDKGKVEYPQYSFSSSVQFGSCLLFCACWSQSVLGLIALFQIHWPKVSILKGQSSHLRTFTLAAPSRWKTRLRFAYSSFKSQFKCFFLFEGISEGPIKTRYILLLSFTWCRKSYIQQARVWKPCTFQRKTCLHISLKINTEPFGLFCLVMRFLFVWGLRHAPCYFD